MPIGKALLLKGLGGLAALGGAIGGGCYIYDYYSNQDTKFDRGLIDYLEAGGDIQFSVKNNSSEVSDSTFQNFSDTSITATIKVSISSASNGNEGTLNDATAPTPVPEKGKKANLKKLNGTGDGTDWTWECKLVFKKVGDTNGATSLKEEERKKVFDSGTPKGLLNKLKENNNKELKIKFIRDCAAARGKDKNKKINGLTSLTATDEVITTANKIESTKEFKLIKGDGTNLVPKDQSDFDHWFKNVSN